jgi:hypothetical protein
MNTAKKSSPSLFEMTSLVAKPSASEPPTSDFPVDLVDDEEPTIPSMRVPISTRLLPISEQLKHAVEKLHGSVRPEAITVPDFISPSSYLRVWDVLPMFSSMLVIVGGVFESGMAIAMGGAVMLVSGVRNLVR